MACRNAYRIEDTGNIADTSQQIRTEAAMTGCGIGDGGLMFGVESESSANTRLQNNLTELEWVARNKVYPNFWGRRITGENSLTKEEIDFIHSKGCKVAAIYTSSQSKATAEQGEIEAKQASVAALELGIPAGAAIFLEIEESESVTTDYMAGYARAILSEGYVPGFRANTDSAFGFDRQYSGGMQSDKELFGQCLIWALSPTLEEYDSITTTHLIHPDNWGPYAPSGITRDRIAVWQYGKKCHPINDDSGKETVFNINLVKDRQMIINVMF